MPETGQPDSHIERTAANMRARRCGVAENFVDEGFANYCEHRLNLAFTMQPVVGADAFGSGGCCRQEGSTQ